MNRLRDTAARWKSTLSAVGVVAVCEIGSRIGIPGVDGKVVHDFINAGHGGLIWLYDFIGGGGVSRAGLLALGVLPYLTARLYLWLVRCSSESIRRRTDDENTKSKVIRVLTIGIAAVQAFGYTTFLTTIPNGVANPGSGFLTRTVLLLTGTAVVESLLLEKMLRRPAPDDRSDTPSEAMVDVSPAPSEVVAAENSPPLLLPIGDVATFTTHERRAPASIE